MTSEVLTHQESLEKIKRIEKDLGNLWLWADDGGVYSQDFAKMHQAIKRIRKHWEKKSGVTAKP